MSSHYLRIVLSIENLVSSKKFSAKSFLRASLRAAGQRITSDSHMCDNQNKTAESFYATRLSQPASGGHRKQFFLIKMMHISIAKARRSAAKDFSVLKDLHKFSLFLL